MLAPALASGAEPLPFPLLSQYARFRRDGVRTDYEEDVRRLGIMTGSVLSVLPIALVFMVGQKYFVQGIATSGLKG